MEVYTTLIALLIVITYAVDKFTCYFTNIALEILQRLHEVFGVCMFGLICWYFKFNISPVVGCADLISSTANAWHKRKGNIGIIGCNKQNKTWHLKCDGERWQGVVGSCDDSSKLKNEFYKSVSLCS